MKKNRKVETIAAQAGVGADKAFGAVSVPIYLSAIYRYERFGKNRGFDYSRGENPTRRWWRRRWRISKEDPAPSPSPPVWRRSPP